MKKYDSINEIRKNAELKVLSLFPSPSLRIRVSLSFLLFGLIIGYLSFMMFMMISTRNYIELAGTLFMDYFKSYSQEKGSDILLKVMNRENTESENRLVHHIASNLHEIHSISLYCNKSEEKRWKYLRQFYRADHKQNMTEKIDHELSNRLDAALKRKITASASLFFGKQDTVSIYVNLTGGSDKNGYILSITANRKGIITFLENNFAHISLFSLLLLLISLLLGSIFSKYLVSPVTSLSEEASEIASGNFKHRFNLKRGDEIGLLADSLNIMADQIEKYIVETERRINTIETMNRIDKAVLSSISHNDLLKRVISIVVSLFEGDSIIMAVRNSHRAGFDLLSSDDPEIKKILGEKPFLSDSLLGDELVQGMQKFSQNIYSESGNIFPREIDAVARGKIGSFVNVPIYISDEYLGSIILTDKEQKVFSDEEIEIITLLADQVGVALQSVNAFEEKEKLLLGILIALTRSIDAKSKWTAGHSERVARLAERTGIKMKLSESELRNLAISAILHDIGKISVPENILDKPDKLTDEEYNMVKKHPSVGAEIIEEIPGYENIVPGILYHHEHWNGGGYPFGLKGKQIPLISRIITVADVFDAVTDDRPYRKGLEPDAARIFIIENSGKLFDPEIVNIFLEIINEENSTGS